MAWTFDPLRARNAHLNLTKLGAVVREYRRDMYGQTDSELHRGIGTDRFVALWLMDSDRVEERLARALPGGGGAGPQLPDPPGGAVSMALEADPGRASGLPRPRAPRLGLDVPRVGVSIPADIGTVMARDPELAAAWRHATRAAFTHYLERGYEVWEVVRASSDRGVATYHMETREGMGAGDIASRASSEGNVE